MVVVFVAVTGDVTLTTTSPSTLLPAISVRRMHNKVCPYCGPVEIHRDGFRSDIPAAWQDWSAVLVTEVHLESCRTRGQSVKQVYGGPQLRSNRHVVLLADEHATWWTPIGVCNHTSVAVTFDPTVFRPSKVILAPMLASDLAPCLPRFPMGTVLKRSVGYGLFQDGIIAAVWVGHLVRVLYLPVHIGRMCVDMAHGRRCQWSPQTRTHRTYVRRRGRL